MHCESRPDPKARSMKYDDKAIFSAATPEVTASIIPGPEGHWVAWQPSTWPSSPDAVDPTFISTLKKIFHESMFDEIQNVITDADAQPGKASHDALEHRGHVVAIALFCALDAISAFGFRGAEKKWGRREHIVKFVRKYFRDDYKPYALDIRDLYRNCMIHGWNLFGPSLSPRNAPPSSTAGTPSFGLLHFFDALRAATERFLTDLASNKDIQKMALERYRALKKTARP
jgi:hypothetical protein